MFQLFKNLRKKDYLIILLIVILIMLQIYFDLKIPDYMSTITKLVEQEVSSTNLILKQGGLMLLCALLSLFFSIVVCYLSATLSATFTKNTRRKLFEKVESFGLNEIKNFKISSLITRTTNDITNVQMFIAMGLQMLIKAPLTAIWAISKILNKSYEWTYVTGGALLILLITIIVLMKYVIPKFKVIQKNIDSLNEITRENLMGIKVIKAYNATKYQENKFERLNDNITDIQMYVGKRMSITNPMMYLTMNLLTLGIYFVGALIINNANLINRIDLFSDMIVFSSYAMQVIMSFIMLVVIFILYPRTSVSASRINEVINTYPTINDGLINKSKENGTIRFDNVYFKYPDSDEYVIENISFDVKKGETVAFIGSTGSGKSTLINLIPRFYDATEGNIYVDDINIKDYSLKELHNKIGYISQKAAIFNGSIKDNVSYGNKRIKNTDIIEAINISEANDFVNKIGIEANISSGGTNLSGGQKQRINIARAIAKKPEIIIFDDSFSALDYKTDYNLRKNIKNKLQDTTVLIVAQRIGTIKDADKIIVLDNGKCVGIGKHEELLKKCKIYKEIAYSQISKEELEHGKSKK